jgi:hypothetical protein
MLPPYSFRAHRSCWRIASARGCHGQVHGSRESSHQPYVPHFRHGAILTSLRPPIRGPSPRGTTPASATLAAPSVWPPTGTHAFQGKSPPEGKAIEDAVGSRGESLVSQPVGQVFEPVPSYGLPVIWQTGLPGKAVLPWTNAGFSGALSATAGGLTKKRVSIRQPAPGSGKKEEELQ